MKALSNRGSRLDSWCRVFFVFSFQSTAWNALVSSSPRISSIPFLKPIDRRLKEVHHNDISDTTMSGDYEGAILRKGWVDVFNHTGHVFSIAARVFFQLTLCS